jgi:glycosyltransferase involved in cell wall biosynthesis
MLASIRDLVARGHAVDLIVMSAAGALMPLLPSEVRVIDLGISRMRSAVWPLMRYLRRERPDALHAQMWPMTVIAVLAHRFARSRAKLIISDQSSLSPHMNSALQLRLLGWSARHFYPRADVRVMCAADAASDLAQVSGLDSASFEIITNPVEPPPILATNAEVEALWGQAEGRIINCGSLKGQKNQALLLRAFAATTAYPGAKLLILGEGPLRGELEALARELGVAERVILPGFDLDPWPYLASADIFALSSNYEGFPLVLAEAMYAGLRLVSTDCPSGPAELTDNGKFGQLVPCGDCAALAAAIDRAWDLPHDSAAQRMQAVALAGPVQIARYSELLTDTL